MPLFCLKSIRNKGKSKTHVYKRIRNRFEPTLQKALYLRSIFEVLLEIIMLLG
jgi:hypothetical protein